VRVARGLPRVMQLSILRVPIPAGRQPGKDAHASSSHSNEDEQGDDRSTRQATGAAARRVKGYDDDWATHGARGPGPR
jgi:hypothetical protein